MAITGFGECGVTGQLKELNKEQVDQMGRRSVVGGPMLDCGFGKPQKVTNCASGCSPAMPQAQGATRKCNDWADQCMHAQTAAALTASSAQTPCPCCAPSFSCVS